MVSEGSVDWGPPAGLQFGRETAIAAYDEARAKALARDDLALLQHYYIQYGTRFGGLPNIVEFGLTATRGSDWLSEGAETVSMTDVVASEVCAACNRLKTKAGSNIKFGVLYNRRDIELLPTCNLLYSHAWAQVYLPDAGWIDFDPTSGSVGNVDLVTVAVVPDPRHAIPLHGTYVGFASDHLGMEVQVSVMSGTPEVIWAAPPAAPRRFGQST